MEWKHIMIQIQKKMQSVLYYLLNDICGKFDAIALKSFIDYLFVLSEKIIIHFPKMLPLYIDYYNDIIDQESNIAQITSISKVLHVGCGSIPASSILLAEKTKASIIGMDKDDRAIRNAEICLQNLGMSQKVKVKKTDSLEMDLSEFDVILISQGIIPKEDFMQKLADKLSVDTIVILRSFSQDELLDSSDNFLHDCYNIIDIFYHKKHGSTSSIILKKKKMV